MPSAGGLPTIVLTKMHRLSHHRIQGIIRLDSAPSSSAGLRLSRRSRLIDGCLALLGAALAILPLWSCATVAEPIAQPDAEKLASAEFLERQGNWMSAGDALADAANEPCVRSGPGRVIPPDLKSKCMSILERSGEDALLANRPLRAADRFREAVSFGLDAVSTTRIRARVNDAEQRWEAQQAAAASAPPCSVAMMAVETRSDVFARIYLKVSLDNVVAIDRGSALLGPAPSAVSSVPPGEHEVAFIGRYRYLSDRESTLTMSTSYYFECPSGALATIGVEVHLASELRSDENRVRFSYTNTPRAP